MELNSTVVTIKNLFLNKFDEEFNQFINNTTSSRQFSIPLYQREYKWEKDKIETLVKDIIKRSKFLGVISVEIHNTAPIYKLVDGQQRLSTLLLILVALYNLCGDDKETATQDEIEKYIFCDDAHQNFIIRNDSVGKFLKKYQDSTNHANKIELCISENPDIDVYRQSDHFSTAYKLISKTLENTHQDINWETLKQQVIDCQVLVFASKNQDGMQQGSIEEIYIDVNEKSQRLDAEDIFKGHCFAICKLPEQHNFIKEKWYSIKKTFFQNEYSFGWN